MAGIVSWLPVFSSTSSVMSSSVVAGSQPVVSSVRIAASCVGRYSGEGLLPVWERLVQKIIWLEFMEMRDLTSDTWMTEEDTKTTLSLPHRRGAPVMDSLQWL